MRATTYRDRAHAGELLAARLTTVTPPYVVAAIPRGGVLVAEPIARRLGCPMTLSFVRRITVPAAPEVAIGTLDENGPAMVHRAGLAERGVSARELRRACDLVEREMRRQRRTFEAPRLETFLPRCTVVLVDDGLATGETMRAAVAHARRLGATRIVVAAPCASVDAIERVRTIADDVVCPTVDPAFFAVGAYYHDFAPVSDADVQAALARLARLVPDTSSVTAHRDGPTRGAGAPF